MRTGRTLGQCVAGRGVWLSGAVAALTYACATEVMEAPEEGMELVATEDPAATERVGQIQSPLLAVTGEFSWSQGQPPVDMGSSTETFCYLTRIQGDFEGGGESVRIAGRNGRWFLEGSSQQSGIGAGARCTPTRFGSRVLLFTPESSWRQGQPPTPMVADNGFTACMLTRVQGKFEGGGERVEITRSNGTWFLGGASRQSGVAAGARCLLNVVVGAGTPSFSTDCESSICSIFLGCSPARCFGPSPTDLGPVTAGFELAIACALASMSGKFEGGAEVARNLHDKRALVLGRHGPSGQ